MPRLVGLALLAAAALLTVTLCTASRLTTTAAPVVPPTPTAAERQAAERADGRWEALAVAATVGGSLLLVGLPLAAVVGVGLWLVGQATTARPDQRGLLPVARRDLSAVAPAAVVGYHQARIAEAQRPIMPAHYAPHYSGRSDAIAAPVEVPTLPAPIVPGFCTLVDALSRWPTPTGQVLLGIGAAGPIMLPMTAANHMAIAGPTGGGKTNLIRHLATMKALSGERLLVLDAHYSRPSWEPFAPWFWQPPAFEPSDIGGRLEQLTDEMSRRLDYWREHEAVPADWPTITAIVDEAPVVLEDKDTYARVVELLRQARKVRIYLMIGSQGFLKSTTKMAADVRSNLVTAYTLPGTDQWTLRGLGFDPAGMPAIEVGQAVLRVKSAEPVLVRVPLVETAEVRHVLSRGETRPAADNGYSTELEPSEAGSLSAIRSPELSTVEGYPVADNEPDNDALIRALIIRGLSATKIATTLTNGDTGRPYRRVRDRAKELGAEG